MRKILSVLFLVLFAFVGSAHSFRLATGQDISIRLPRNQRCKWYDGRTATQPERAAMYLFGVAKMMPEGLLYAKTNPYCADVARGISASNLEIEDTRLRVYYVDQNRNPVWGIFGDNGCPDYEHVQDLGERLQTCSTKSDAAKRTCAASTYLSKDILSWADLRVENGKCEKGADYTLLLPGKEDNVVAKEGFLDYRVPLPPITPAQRSLLNNLMGIHHSTDEAFCAGTQGPPAGSVKKAALEFINSASDERQRHAFLLEFATTRDESASGWTAQEHCDWGMLKGAALHEWAKCFDLTGTAQWVCLTRTRISHETLHRCAALKNTKRVRVGDHTDKQLTSLPMRTCADVLRCQTGELSGCRLPWLPADWRKPFVPGSH